MPLIPSRTRKGLGLKFEEGDPTTFGLNTLDLAGVAVPESFLNHEHTMPKVDGKRFQFDQQATSSCVANAFLHGVILKEARAGLPFDEPSRLHPYWFGRKETGDQWFDRGTYLSSVGVALRKFGAPSERFWKWGQFSARVNRRPNWTAMRNAHPRAGGKYVRIYEMGIYRVQAIQQALLNGHDVAFGTRLGKSFLPSSGPFLVHKPPATEEIAGNHAMLIIGWQKFNGVLFFRVLNSWGADWRDEGMCWMSADYISWAQTQDLHIIHGWARLGDRT